MVTMFIDALQPSFYEKMLENVSSNFSDLDKVGTTMAKKIISSAKKRKRGEANTIVSSLAKHNGEIPQGTSNYQPHFLQNPQVITLQPYTYPYPYQTPYQTPHRPPYQPMPSYRPPALQTTRHQNTQAA
ncbi:hypothetical protein CR513_53683, partial [Mucuna pruriens]